jgi:hypothetical protein
MDRPCSIHGEKRTACTVLVGKPNGKRPLRRPIRRWEDNIKMDLIMIQIFSRLRNNIFIYLSTLHVSTPMGHLQVFSYTLFTI